MRKYQITILLSVLSYMFGLGQVPNLEWAGRMGGTSFDRPDDLAVDASGNVFTIGFFTTTADFDPGAGVLNLTSAGGRDVFITKFDPNGNLIWARQIGGTGEDQGTAVAIDHLGNIYMAGTFNGTVDFDPGPATFNLTAASGGGFLVKWDVNGNFLWANQTGAPYRIALDGSGNIHLSGFFNGTVDFDPGTGVFNLTSAGSRDIFITKLNTNGELIWAKRIGSTQLDDGRSIAVDNMGNVYTTGFFMGTVDFDPGAAVFNLTSTGSEDIFVSKLDADGNFVWAVGIGAANFDTGQGIAVDDTGVYTTGYFQGTADFDPGAGVLNLTSAGDRDIFVLKLDLNGNLVWAKNIGGAARDDGRDIAVDANGNVYATGFFQGTVDFDPGAGIVNKTSAGTLDIFVLKLNATGNFEWVRRVGGIDWDQGAKIYVDGGNNIYLTGHYRNSVDFDPGPCVRTLTANTEDEIFVMKFRQQPLVGDPTITSFSPLSGNVGTTVTITGTNFAPVPANNIVEFNGIAANITASTTTSITTTIPTGATTGKITVIADCIGVQSSTNFIIGAPSVPTITSFTPSSGPVGTTVTITGTNFSTTLADNTVRFNGTIATVTASTTASITTTVPPSATTGPITVMVAGNTATSSTNFIVTTGTNQPPVIQSTVATVPVNGIVSLDLQPLLSDPDDNLDLSTLSLLSSTTESGASATLVGTTILELNYGSTPFAGTDRISISVCDLLSACTQQLLAIEVGGDIVVFNGFSPNGDDTNEFFFIQYIELFPDTQKNKVTIFNRWGDLVFDISDYDNQSRVFRGLNKNGNELPSGTYFYKLEFASGRPTKTGYLSLKK
ncbi:MAG: gliding motility-associated C-terminal domain-containing protein [Cyclobacteriaceae bacterium]|nr:gliding motility-associated C-terminal domain-containing protein [Cyclobacteriaceae bacterium]